MAAVCTGELISQMLTRLPNGAEQKQPIINLMRYPLCGPLKGSDQDGQECPFSLLLRYPLCGPRKGTDQGRQECPSSAVPSFGGSGIGIFANWLKIASKDRQIGLSENGRDS